MLLRHEGWEIYGNQVYGLYKEMGLPLRKKLPRQLDKATLRKYRCGALQVYDLWVMDFLHDQHAMGPKLPS